MYYVAPDGDDGNPGTISEPWQTVQKATTTLQAGDTVYIRAGTYNEQLVPQNSGTVTDGYITYAAYPGEVATLDGTGLGANVVHVSGKGYIRISGLRVENSSRVGIYASGCHHLVIERNHTYGAYSSGIGVWHSNNIIIDGNDVEMACDGGHEEMLTVANSHDVEVMNNHVHNGPASTPHGGEGINIKCESHDIKVHHNVVNDIIRYAFGVDGSDDHLYNVEFYSNVAYNSGQGFIVEAENTGTTENIKVYNNIAYNNNNPVPGVGFYIPYWNRNNESPKRNVYFINNVSHGNGYGVRIWSTNVENIVIKNNILSQNGTQVAMLSGVEAQVTVDNNLFDSGAYGTNPIVGAPLFIDPDGGDFHLQSSSPAIDAGVDASEFGVVDDFDGNPRPQGEGYDVGAHEYIGPVVPTVTATSTVTPIATSTPEPTATATPASGEDVYYVAPDGDDSSPGTLDAPWRTVQHGVDAMTGGDTVYLRAGTYNEEVIFEFKGNESGPWMTLAAYPGEEAVIDGSGISLSKRGLIHIWYTDYVRVKGLRIQYSRQEGIYIKSASNIEILDNSTYSTAKSGVGVWASSYVLVDGNDIELMCNPTSLCSEENISVAESSHHVIISNNHVHDGPTIPGGFAGGEGINVKQGSHDVVIAGNVVHDLQKLGFGLDAWDRYTYNVEYYNNVAYRTKYGFIVSAERGGTTENVRLYNNVAYDIPYAGFAIPHWSGTTDGPKRNIQFVNNTSYNNGYGFWTQTGLVEDVLIRNNIFSQNDTSVRLDSGSAAETIVDHNLFDGGGTYGDYQVVGDPLFVDPAGADFHLQSGSPAIDAGSSLNAPDDDFDGDLRGAAVDIGADEYID